MRRSRIKLFTCLPLLSNWIESSFDSMQRGERIIAPSALIRIPCTSIPKPTYGKQYRIQNAAVTILIFPSAPVFRVYARCITKGYSIPKYIHPHRQQKHVCCFVASHQIERPLEDGLENARKAVYSALE